jgi:serine/threonine protein kinase
MGEKNEDDNDDVHDDDEYYLALKLFSLRDPNQRTMLVRELTLLCTFRCDCLVQMEGAFLDLVNKGNCIDKGAAAAASNSEGSSSFSSASGNTVTLVLEYMDRGSLADLIIAAKVEEDSGASTMIPEYAIAAIAYQILWGLSYLHFEGVLHRDIKPANVLVSSSGRVKLADFGIVSKQKQLLRRSGDDNDDGDDVNEGTIMNRTVIGTTRYMSPERLRGETYKRSSDVWSVGLVLLEIVRGGISPFEEVTSVVELVQTLDECRMNDYIPESTSNGLREILVGSLDHCPHKRIPASILLSSPWFQFHNIHGVQDASSLMMVYLDTTK